MQSINELLDTIVADVSGECNDTCNLFNRSKELGGPAAPAYLASPRSQLRKWLENTASYIDDGWHGPASITALLGLVQGTNSKYVIEQLVGKANADGKQRITGEAAAYASMLNFLVIRRMFPMLAAPEFGSIQPLPSIYGQQFFLDTVRLDPKSMGMNAPSTLMQLRLCSVTTTAKRENMVTTTAEEAVETVRTRAHFTLDVGLEAVSYIGYEMALQLNYTLLKEIAESPTGVRLEFGTNPPNGKTEEGWRGYIGRYVDQLSTEVFKRRFGDITHLIAGPKAFLQLSHIFAPQIGRVATNDYPGVGLSPFSVGYMPGVRVYRCSMWCGADSDLIVGLRRGSDWSDTPLVWSPFVTTTRGMNDWFTFDHQGCQAVVAPSALARLVVNENIIGVELN